jgi:hypothetical protein
MHTMYLFLSTCFDPICMRENLWKTYVLDGVTWEEYCCLILWWLQENILHGYTIIQHICQAEKILPYSFVAILETKILYYQPPHLVRRKHYYLLHIITEKTYSIIHHIFQSWPIVPATDILPYLFPSPYNHLMHFILTTLIFHRFTITYGRLKKIYKNQQGNGGSSAIHTMFMCK